MRLRAHTPGGSKLLQQAQHRLDLGQRRAELLGDRRKVAGEIAGLVDQIDQVLADHAPHRIGDRERELLGQMIGERRLGRDEGFEIVVAVLAPAAADAGPFRIGRRLLGGGARRRGRGIVGKDVVEVGVEPVLDRGPAGLQILADPVAAAAVAVAVGRRAQRAPRRLRPAPSPSPARSSRGFFSSSPST